MSTLFLSRARLKRDASLASLAQLLLPAEAGARTASSHRLVWALFADGPNRRRDFLWREEGPGRFMTLSARPPNRLDDLFDLDSQEFAPALVAGDRLGFTLRANPVIARSAGPGQRGKRHDVVMDALHHLPIGERTAHRPDAVITAGRAWFERQGTTHGFEPDKGIDVEGYDTLRIPRDHGGEAAKFGVLELKGVLKVQDPKRFIGALATGFGRARAFGCGLMLIRRVR